jgi:hypothetical protein
VIRLGARLAVAGGREAITRLALIAVAVAVGSALLLATLAGLNAVQTQNARYAWLETGYAGSNAPGGAAAARSGAGAPLWWRLRADQFRGELIGRVDLAATGAGSSVPPGLARLPGAGEYFASPALARLVRSTPRAELGARYPGVLVGTIGAAGLPSPDSLIIVIGHRAAELARDPRADLVARISTTVPSRCRAECALGVGTDSNGITLILSVVAAALLFPVLIFIGAATRLSAARREQRFAAMRLVGATPRQISVIATVESAIAAVAGVAAGFALFYAIRPAIATIPFTGDRFFPGDLALPVTEIVAVALGVPLAAAVVARLALRRVNIAPLGVTRRATPRPPRAWRLVPLLAGVGELGYFAYLHDIGADTRTNTTLEAIAFLAGVLLMMAGLVIAGPWLTMLVSRLVARRAGRAATLIAARRLADNPQAGFRAISGLVLAVFVGTCATAIITTIVAYTEGSGPVDSSAAGTLVTQLGGPQPGPAVSVAPRTIRQLDAIDAVTGVVIIRKLSTGLAPAGQFAPEQLGVDCRALAAVPALGHCPPGAASALIFPDYGGGLLDHEQLARVTWPAAPVGPGELRRRPVDSIVVGTDGSVAAIERARTVLDRAYPATFPPQTIGEIRATTGRLLDDYRRLADVVILTSLPIAGCSLAVSIAGGLAERKRPFSLLRLAGTPLAVLRRVIGLEAAAPLLVTAAASVAAGLLAAQLFLRAQLAETVRAPGLEYYVVLVIGLLVSLGLIASTLPLLNRSTGPEIARND